MCQHLVHQFQEQWVAQYLTSLHKAGKWNKPQRNLQVGDVVLLKDEEMFARSWPKGLIIKTYPGTDGKVRVVDVKTEKGISHKRPIVKVVVLLPQDENLGQAAGAGGVCLGPEALACLGLQPDTSKSSLTPKGSKAIQGCREEGVITPNTEPSTSTSASEAELKAKPQEPGPPSLTLTEDPDQGTSQNQEQVAPGGVN